MITVAICDDHQMVRDALEGVINLYEGVQVVASVDSASNLKDVVSRQRPDVAVIDIRLEGESGLDAARDLSRVSPQTRVIMLTSFSDDSYLVQAHELGASAFLLKSGTPDELVTAVRNVAAGGILIDERDVEAARERLRRRP